MTRKSFSDPLTPRILSLCSSCTALISSAQGGQGPKSELTHQTGETLECTWDSDTWVDLDKNTLGGVDVNL